MSRPRISVVTPSYNQAEYIEDNIHSVKRQRYPAVEHVVVDGESTDGTLDVLRRHEDDYALRWTSEPDEGQSDAINTGFDRATGDIVGWLNSDDVYFDTAVFSRVADHFERTDADVIYGDLAYVDATSTVTEIDVRPDFDRDSLRYRSLVGQPAAFFRADVLADERLDEDLHYCMDWEFWLRLSADYEFVHVRDVLAGFRYHAAQKTEQPEGFERDYRTLMERYGGDHSRRLLFDVVPMELRRYLAALHFTIRLHRDPPELAFDGGFDPLHRMLARVGPGWNDVSKSLRRWREDR